MISTKCLGRNLSKKATLKFGLIIGFIIFGLIIFKTESVSVENTDFTVMTFSSPLNVDSDSRAPPDSTTLINFLEPFINDQLSRFNVPGMTISVVMDDEIIYAQGFGYSDYSPIKFVHNQTLFRIGSVSKTFTAIAALQLVEDGILDLNTDINDYLVAFQIPDTFPEPITLKHLLTHTPGFEEFPAPVVYGSAVSLSLEEILMGYMPDRVNPPGVISSYSNYGLGLIGYLIQELSGKPFEQYIEDEILYPLGMNHTSFRQPLPAALALNMSNGYYDGVTEKYFEYVTLPSAGSCSSTASDMAILMLTLLNNGTYNGTEILQNTSVEMMFESQFLPHENLPGVGFGLYEFYPNNVKAWGHGGDTTFFHSNMILFPEENFGFFISYNSYNGAFAKSEFLDAFIQTFYPYTSDPIIPMEGFDKGLNQYTGYYIKARRYYSDKDITSYENDEIISSIDIMDWLELIFDITTNNGYLKFDGIGLDFVQVEPDYFVEASGVYDFEMAFIRNSNGEVSYLYANFMTSLVANEKIHPFYYESGGVYAVIIIASSAYFLTLLWWAIEAIIDSRKKKEKKPILQNISKGLVAGVLVLNAILIGIFVPLSRTRILIEAETISDFGGLIALPIIVIVLIAGMIALSVLSWIGIGNKERKPYGKLWERIHYLFLIVLSSAFIFAFAYWLF